MTDPDNPDNDEPQDPAADTGGGNSAAQDVDAATDSSSAKDKDVVEHPQKTVVAGDLPEEEELTPELVEDEAIRGDFMLRWAAIFLAVLFGFSQMTDTRTLVHVRSGDQLRAGGLLPATQDAFSYGLDGQSTSNVSWLFDHLISGVYSAGGENALTVFKALLAGVIAWLLSLISLRNMPTWWNSICLVFAVAACSVDFMPVTDLATLLGLTVTLLLLHKHSEGTASGLSWRLPVIVAVWANFDPRAYLGVAAVALFALGSTLRKSMAEKAGHSSGTDVSVLWKAAAFCLLALLVNPSPVASLLSVVTTYTVEYPSMAAMSTLSDPASLLDGRTEYYSIFVPEVLQGIEFAYVAGLSLLVIAIVVLVIGRSRENLPWAVVLIGFMALALFRLHELPAAALVAAAAAGTAAQRWYSGTFRQEYSVDTMEVLFSRGGRAVTVLAMAFLGFCAVADRLPSRTAIGMGFDPELRETIDSLGTQLADLPDNATIFNTLIAQGDLLIWHGRRSFTDSRTALFGDIRNPESVMSRFDILRRSLLPRPQRAAPAPPGVGDPPADDSAADDPEEDRFDPDWKAVYDDKGISHVMLRLCPPGRPAYPMVRAFLRNPNWVLDSRGASAAMFTYSEEPQGLGGFDLREAAFRIEPEDDQTPNLERLDYAQEPSFYQQYLYKSRPAASAALREAQHLLELDLFPQQVVFDLARAARDNPQNQELMSVLGRALACPLLVIRRANEALLKNPQNAGAYRALGSGYVQLNGCEQAIARALDGQDVSELRYYQAVMAFRQAATIEPEVSGTWRMLAGLYEERGRTELAFECLRNYLNLEEETLLDSDDPGVDAELRQLYDKQKQWEQRRQDVESQLETILQQPMPEDPQQQAFQKLEIIQGLYSSGQVRVALRLMKENQSLLAGNPQAEVLRGQMLLEVGELDDGFQVLNQIAGAAQENLDSPRFAGVKWQKPSALSHLGNAGYAEAVSAYQSHLSVFDHYETKSPDLMNSIVRMLPLVPAVDAVGSGGALPLWPMVLLRTSQLSLVAVPASRSEPTFLMALAYLEDGNLTMAQEALTTLIAESGENRLRPLASVYLLQLSDSGAAVIADSTVSPWEDFTFPGDESPDSNDSNKIEAAAAPSAPEKQPANAKPNDGEKTSKESPNPSNDSDDGKTTDDKSTPE